MDGPTTHHERRSKEANIMKYLQMMQVDRGVLQMHDGPFIEAKRSFSEGSTWSTSVIRGAR
jgi:hypothetical protein